MRPQVRKDFPVLPHILSNSSMHSTSANILSMDCGYPRRNVPEQDLLGPHQLASVLSAQVHVSVSPCPQKFTAPPFDLLEYLANLWSSSPSPSSTRRPLTPAVPPARINFLRRACFLFLFFSFFFFLALPHNPKLDLHRALDLLFLRGSFFFAIASIWRRSDAV